MQIIGTHSLIIFAAAATRMAATQMVQAQQDQGDFVFTKQLLRLTELALRLSNVAYTEAQPIFGQSSMTIYRDEPDQALVTKIDGYCWGAFRGTVYQSWDDWMQNLMVGDDSACSNTGDCCNVQEGHYQAYFQANYRKYFEETLRDCVATCTDTDTDDTCPVVLAGHSQGGAVAIVAAISLADLNPTVITFGQPPTVDLPCEALDHAKVYRFQNSRAGWFGPTYDPVPAIPYQARQIGHHILLSDDSTGVAYIGLDSQTTFWPMDFGNAFASHRLEPENNVGYIDRVESLVLFYSSHEGNVRSNGFITGTRCSQDVECVSGSCHRKRCQ